MAVAQVKPSSYPVTLVAPSRWRRWQRRLANALGPGHDRPVIVILIGLLVLTYAHVSALKHASGERAFQAAAVADAHALELTRTTRQLAARGSLSEVADWGLAAGFQFESPAVARATPTRARPTPIRTPRAVDLFYARAVPAQ